MWTTPPECPCAGWGGDRSGRAGGTDCKAPGTSTGRQQLGTASVNSQTSSPTTLIMQHRTSFLHTLYDPSHTHSPLSAHPVQSLSHPLTPYLHTLYNPSHTHSPLICTPCTIPLTPTHPLSAHPVQSLSHPFTPYLHTLYNPSHTHSPLICTPCTIPLTPIHPLSHTLYNPSHTHSPLISHPVQSLSHPFTPYLTPCMIPLTSCTTTAKHQLDLKKGTVLTAHKHL